MWAVALAVAVLELVRILRVKPHSSIGRNAMGADDPEAGT